MNIIETTDFNNDGAYTGSDLDIAWAYLQIKALFEAGDATITPANFVEKVVAQYDLNKSANIAEQSDDVTVSLPGNIADGAPAPRIPVQFKKLWIFHNPDSPTTIMESISGLDKGTMTDVNWFPSGTTKDTDLMYLKNSSVISLDDEGDLRSDRNWTLYIKGQFKGVSNNKSIFKKGNFEMVFYTSGEKVSVRVSSSGASWGQRIHNYYASPYTPAELDWKEFEVSLVREGVTFKLYINGEECYKSAQGDSPDPIFGEDKNLPIVLKGTEFSRLDKIYITESSFIGFSVLDAVGDYHGDVNLYSFAHDMDISNSYYQWNQYFPDRYGSFAKLFNIPSGNIPEKQKHWVTPPTLDTGNGYVAKSKCLKLGEYDWGEYMKLPTVDFRKDFTISFWVSFNDTDKDFLEVEGEDGSKLRMRFFWKKTEAEGLKVWIGSEEKVFPVPGLGAGADAKWQHITVIKNGPFVGVVTNGTFPDTWTYFNLSNGVQTAMGSGNVTFINPNKAKNLYLSHIRVLDYAVSHIPRGGVGGLKTNYNYFMDDLLMPIEPGRTS